jgi:hypothetical protein
MAREPAGPDHPRREARGRLLDVQLQPIGRFQRAKRRGGMLVVCSETTATVLVPKHRAEEVLRQREMFSQARASPSS